MPLSSCPGCRYDEERRKERAEKRRQNRKLNNKQPKAIDNHDHRRPETIREGSDEWETDDEKEEEFMDMVDAFMSKAYLYTKTMREMMAMDKEKGKQAGRVLAGVTGNPSMMNEKKKKKDSKGKKPESGSSRTQVKGDRSGKMKEQQPSGSSIIGGPSIISGPSGTASAAAAPFGTIATTSRYSLDDTD